MKLKGVLVAVVALLGVCMFPGDASAEVLCPTGTVNADKKVGSYAECNIPKDEGKRDLLGTVNTIISVIAGVLGVVAVVMVVIGGITYATSAGDATKVKKATNTIIYGFIGLFVAILSYSIVNFVLGNGFKDAEASETEDE